jgi:aconitate hydratase
MLSKKDRIHYIIKTICGGNASEMARRLNLSHQTITAWQKRNTLDYDKVAEGDEIAIEGFAEAIKGADSAYLTVKKTGEKLPLVLNFSARQREILLAGGTLNYTKNQK